MCRSCVTASSSASSAAADFLKVLVSNAGSSSDETSDRSIHRRLLAELRNQRWAKPNASDIVVSDGVVHLWGIVGSEEEHKALWIAAENTPGVRGVHDHTISGPSARDHSSR